MQNGNLTQETPHSDQAKRSTGNARFAKATVQAREMQDILWKDCLTGETERSRSDSARAWVAVTDMRQKLLLKPYARPVDVSKLPKRGRRSVASSEPVEPGTPQPVVTRPPDNS